MSWRDYERAADEGPWPITLKVVGFLTGLIVLLFGIGYVLGWFGSAAKVAKDEFGPQAALTKYEWFIDRQNAIEKMDQDVVLFENRRADVERKYRGYGDDMSKWPLDVRVSYNRESGQARDDLVAVVSQRNNLVKEYNAESEKFNWAPFKTKPDKPRERMSEYVIK